MTQSSDNAALKQARNKRLGLFAGLVVLIAVAVTVYWKLAVAPYVSTDNAYTAVEIAQITPAVGGIVAEVPVKDTQAVKKGDVLVIIDATDARLALAQAEADYQRTLRQVRTYYANDRNLDAQIAARHADLQRARAELDMAQANFERARIDLERRQDLVVDGAVSEDELTQVRNAFLGAQAALAGVKAANAQAEANLKSAQAAREASSNLIADTTADTHPEVQLAKARLEQARVDLERTTLRAPVDGVVAKRQVQVGQRVQPGMALMAVVPVQDIYVDANFKEVQLARVRPGQKATVHADLYGKDVVYEGEVLGFAGGTGSAFAAIPAQNATGNWIKVVQRLPVRIKLDPQTLAEHPLKVGLSMQVKIDTRSGE